MFNEKNELRNRKDKRENQIELSLEMFAWHIDLRKKQRKRQAIK